MKPPEAAPRGGARPADGRSDFGPTPGGRYIAQAKRRPGAVAVVETIFTDQAYIDAIRKAF